ncbi:MAG: hypothetical protein RUDDFDWM_001081 [Candidatus Fervidibacterota bacterium]
MSEQFGFRQPTLEKRSYLPKLVFIETTVACNLSCLHCRRTTTSPKEQLHTEEIMRLIEELVEVGKPVLVFSGGEPLLRDDIFELVRHANSLGLITCMATNATLMTKEMAAEVKASGIKRCAVSLDGPSADVHDAIRGVKGAFERTVTGIKNLLSCGVEVQINITLTRTTKPYLRPMHQLAKALGAVALHVFLLVPVGCGAQLADTEMMTPHECEEALEELCELMFLGELPIRATCAPHFYRIVAQKGLMNLLAGQQSRLSSFTRGCLAGTGVCFISQSGDVMPCGYLPIPAGNIRTQSFSEIWHHSKLFEVLRDCTLLEGKCGVCEFKDICYGCRARAYFATGNMMAQEPLCAYEPKGFLQSAKGFNE